MYKKIILLMLIIFGVVAVSGCIGTEDTPDSNINPIDGHNDKKIDNASDKNQSNKEKTPPKEPKPPKKNKTNKEREPPEEPKPPSDDENS